jgi:hypothetical protein
MSYRVTSSASDRDRPMTASPDPRNPSCAVIRADLCPQIACRRPPSAQRPANIAHICRATRCHRTSLLLRALAAVFPLAPYAQNGGPTLAAWNTLVPQVL